MFGLNIEGGRAGVIRAVSTPGTSTSVAPVAVVDQLCPAGNDTRCCADGEFDVGNGGEFDRRRDQRQLVAGAIDRGRGAFDPLHAARQ